jgi:3-(3-hydroxy-phenyl)propionate hydroxylase
MMRDEVETEVAVVGAGPIGVTIANLLGVYGIQTVLIDRSTEIPDYPRAVGMDDEALRVFQTAGLANELLADMIQNVPLRLFNAKGRLLADIRPQTREFGWWRRNIFMQQLAEKTLRRGLDRFPHVRMRLGEELTALVQDERGVVLETQDAGGCARRIRSLYCVGADGARSTVRGLLGIQLPGNTHPIKWLVVDVRNAKLDAPYSALHCDPRRPRVCICLPFNFRRWEFMVFPHESEVEMQQADSVRRVLAAYVPDSAQVDIIRTRIYTHHSRIADRFVVGRAALAGDAAHLTPPWIGQGLNMGVRDAGNIAWKLAGIVRGRLSGRALASYDTERRDHAKAMTDLADTFGRILMPTNRVHAALRDAFFATLGGFAGIRDYLLQMRFKPMPRYDRGLVIARSAALASSPVGRMFIQPDVETSEPRTAKLDDVLGPGFAVVGWRLDPYEALDAEARVLWGRNDATFIRIDRSRSGESRMKRVFSSTPTQCVEDVDNVLGDWFGRYHTEVIVLRPDRYVAVAASAATINAATREFMDVLC